MKLEPPDAVQSASPDIIQMDVAWSHFGLHLFLSDLDNNRSAAKRDYWRLVWMAHKSEIKRDKQIEILAVNEIRLISI